MMSEYQHRAIVADTDDDAPPEGYVEVRDTEGRRLFVEASLYAPPLAVSVAQPERATLDDARRVRAAGHPDNPDHGEVDTVTFGNAAALLSQWEPAGVVGRYAGEDEQIPPGYVEACVRPPSGRRVFLLRAAVPPYLATGSTSLIELGDGIAVARGRWPRLYRSLLTGISDGTPRLIDAGELGDAATMSAAAAAGGHAAPVPLPGTREFDELLGVGRPDPDPQIAFAASTLASIMAIDPGDAIEIEAALERLGIRTDTRSGTALKARAQLDQIGTVTLDADKYARLVAAAMDVEGTRERYESLLKAMAFADPVTVDTTADPTDPEHATAPGTVLPDEQRRAWSAESGLDVERRRAWLDELMAEAAAGHGDLGPRLTEIVHDAVRWRDERDAARTALALLSNPLSIPLPPAGWQDNPWAVDMIGTLNRTRDALVNTSGELARLSGIEETPRGEFTAAEPHPATLVQYATAGDPTSPVMLASPFPVFFGGQNGTQRVAVNVTWVELLLSAFAGATAQNAAIAEQIAGLRHECNAATGQNAAIAEQIANLRDECNAQVAAVYRERNAWAARGGADANAAAAKVGSGPVAVVAEDADPGSPGYAMFYDMVPSGPGGALEQVSLHFNVAQDGDQFAGFPRVPGNPHDGHTKTEINERLARAVAHDLATAASAGAGRRSDDE